MERTEKGYRLSSGREFYANGGLISISINRYGEWSIAEGYDGDMNGATGAADPDVSDLREGERPENWTVDEQRELADFMIAQWAAFKASLESSHGTPLKKIDAERIPHGT